MMRPVPRILRLSQCGLAVIALVLSLTADGNAQSQEWLLGKWSGTYSVKAGAGMSYGSGTLTVREEAGTLKWRRTTESPRGGKGEAEGVVTKFDASSAEFEGKVISHWIPDYVGSGVKMSFTRSPSGLSGSGWSDRINSTTAWEFTKGK